MTFHIFRTNGRWTVTMERQGLTSNWFTTPEVVGRGLASKRQAVAIARALGGRSAAVRIETT